MYAKFIYGLLAFLLTLSGCAHKIETRDSTSNRACSKSITKTLAVVDNSELPSICKNELMLKACLKVMGFDSLSEASMTTIVWVNNTAHFVRAVGCSGT